MTFQITFPGALCEEGRAVQELGSAGKHCGGQVGLLSSMGESWR